VREPGHNTSRIVLKNATSQTGGRWFLTVARFGIAALIVRHAGVERFGEYSIVLSLLFLAELAVDFGMTDIIVNAICQQPERLRALTKAMSAAKGMQAVVGVLVLVVVLLVMGYPKHVINSGLVAAVSLPLFAGILVYRAVFRVRMIMGREVLAEVLGVLVMIPLVWLACIRNSGLEVLVACHVVSRVVFLLASAMMAPATSLNPVGALRSDVGWALKTSAPLGFTGVLMSAYLVMDPVMLEKINGMRIVGQFSIAMRFITPVLLLVQAVVTAVYPVLASLWQRNPARFRKTLQVSLDVAILVGGAALCLFQCGANGMTAVMGGGTKEAADALRLLAWGILPRAISTTISSLFVISNHLRPLLWLSILAVVVKGFLLLLLAPVHGASGAAIAFVTTEYAVGLLPLLFLAHRMFALPIRWNVLARVAVVSAIVIGASRITGIQGSLRGCLLACVLYPSLVVATRVVTAKQLRQLTFGPPDGSFKSRPQPPPLP